MCIQAGPVMTGMTVWHQTCHRAVWNGADPRPDSSSALNSGQGSKRALASSGPKVPEARGPRRRRHAWRRLGECTVPDLAWARSQSSASRACASGSLWVDYDPGNPWFTFSGARLAAAGARIGGADDGGMESLRRSVAARTRGKPRHTHPGTCRGLNRC